MITQPVVLVVVCCRGPVRRAEAHGHLPRHQQVRPPSLPLTPHDADAPPPRLFPSTPRPWQGRCSRGHPCLTCILCVSLVVALQRLRPDGARDHRPHHQAPGAVRVQVREEEGGRGRVLRQQAATGGIRRAAERSKQALFGVWPMLLLCPSLRCDLPNRPHTRTGDRPPRASGPAAVMVSSVYSQASTYPCFSRQEERYFHSLHFPPLAMPSGLDR